LAAVPIRIRDSRASWLRQSRSVTCHQF